MKKKELIERLKGLSRKNLGWRGQRPFVNFLIYYLEGLNIPNDEKYDFWHLDPFIPQVMIDAFEQLRLGTDEQTAKFRRSYELEVGHKVPNITDIGASNILDQCNTVQTTLSFMLEDVMGDKGVRYKIDAYCNAQRHVLMQFFDKFLRSVYRQGMYQVIRECNKSGMSGKFGETELRTFLMAGRVMFTFARKIDPKKDNHYKDGDEIRCNEWSVSFVGEDGDPLGLSAGIQSVHANLHISLNLIEEVIEKWPQSKAKQKKIFKPADKIVFV